MKSTERAGYIKKHRSGRGLLVLWIVVVVLDLVALAGINRLEFSGGFDRVFRNASDRYQTYTAHIERTGRTESVLLFLEADDLTVPKTQAALQDFVLELQLLPGVDAIASPFSVPLPGQGDSFMTLETLPGDPAVTWRAARDGSPLLARMLDAEASRMLIAISAPGPASLVDTIDQIAQQILTPGGVDHALTGLPVVAARSEDLLISDFLRLNLLGAALGLAAAVVALGGWRRTGFVALASGTALLWGLGALGWLGAQITVVTVALPVLILTLALSDAVHLAAEMRTMRAAGEPGAVVVAVRQVSPAILLTSLTTSVAFLSLALTGSDALAQMGWQAAIAVPVASLGVLAAAMLLGSTQDAWPDPRRRLAVAPLSRKLDWRGLARIACGSPRCVVIASATATLLGILALATSNPRFSLYENLPADDPALAVLAQVEAHMGPVLALDIVLAPAGQDPIPVARKATRRLRELNGAASPLSIAAIADAMQEDGGPFKPLDYGLPSGLAETLTGNEAQGPTLILPFNYVDAATTRALVREIERRLAPGDEDALGSVTVTGLPALSSFASAEMIRSLSLSMLVSVAVTGLIVALWLKSARAGLIALLPNVLPIAVVGGVLSASGMGVSLAAGIALVVAFGIAADDTIHVMNRLRLTGGSGLLRVLTATDRISAPVVATSLVLTAGLCGTLAAEMPSIIEFGLLAIMVFSLALVADLMLLPALLVLGSEMGASDA